MHPHLKLKYFSEQFINFNFKRERMLKKKMTKKQAEEEFIETLKDQETQNIILKQRVAHLKDEMALVWDLFIKKLNK